MDGKKLTKIFFTVLCLIICSSTFSIAAERIRSTAVLNSGPIRGLEVRFKKSVPEFQQYSTRNQQGSHLEIFEMKDVQFNGKNFWYWADELDSRIEKISVVHYTQTDTRVVFRVKKGWTIGTNARGDELIFSVQKKVNQKRSSKIATRKIAAKKEVEKAQEKDGPEDIAILKSIDFQDDRIRLVFSGKPKISKPTILERMVFLEIAGQYPEKEYFKVFQNKNIVGFQVKQINGNIAVMLQRRHLEKTELQTKQDGLETVVTLEFGPGRIEDAPKNDLGSESKSEPSNKDKKELSEPPKISPEGNEKYYKINKGDISGEINLLGYKASSNQSADHSGFATGFIKVKGESEPFIRNFDQVKLIAELKGQHGKWIGNGQKELGEVELSQASIYLRKGIWEYEAGKFIMPIGEIPRLRTLADSACPRDMRFISANDEDAMLGSYLASLAASGEIVNFKIYAGPPNRDRQDIFGGLTALYGNIREAALGYALPPFLDQYIRNIDVQKKEPADWEYGAIIGADLGPLGTMNAAYQSGSNDSPFVDSFPIKGIKASDDGRIDPSALNAISLETDRILKVRYPRFSQFSIFGNFEAGNRLWRYEIAYRDRFPQMKRNLESDSFPMLANVIGTEEDTDWGLFSGYLIHNHLFRINEDDLLFARTDDFQAALYWEKEFFEGRAKLEAGGITALDRREHALRIEASAKLAEITGSQNEVISNSTAALYLENNGGKSDTLMGSRPESRIGLSFTKNF